MTARVQMETHHCLLSLFIKRLWELRHLFPVYSQALDRRYLVSKMLHQDRSKVVNHLDDPGAVIGLRRRLTLRHILEQRIEALPKGVVLLYVGLHDALFPSHGLHGGEEIRLLVAMMESQQLMPSQYVGAKLFLVLGLHVRSLEVDGIEATYQAVVDKAHLRGKSVKGVWLQQVLARLVMSCGMPHLFALLSELEIGRLHQCKRMVGIYWCHCTAGCSAYELSARQFIASE